MELKTVDLKRIHFDFFFVFFSLQPIHGEHGGAKMDIFAFYVVLMNAKLKIMY